MLPPVHISTKKFWYLYFCVGAFTISFPLFLVQYNRRPKSLLGRQLGIFVRINAEVATLLGSIPESSITVESEGRQMKMKHKHNKKIHLLKYYWVWYGTIPPLVKQKVGYRLVISKLTDSYAFIVILEEKDAMDTVLSFEKL